MRKHGGTPSGHDKYLTLATISPSAVARGCFVGGHQSGIAGCKSPFLFKHGACSCPSQGRRQEEPWEPLDNRVHLPYLPELVDDRVYFT